MGLASGLVMSKVYWSPLLALGIAFHAAIAIMMGVTSFSIAMIAALILYLRPTESVFDLPVWIWRPGAKHKAAEVSRTRLGRRDQEKNL